MPIKLTQKNEKILASINTSIASSLKSLFKKKAPRIEKFIKTNTYYWLIDQPEIQSILDEGRQGSLNSKFGFWPGSAVGMVEELVLAVVDSVSVTVSPIDARLSGGIVITIQPETFSNLFSSRYNIVTEAGISLNWVEWLLTRGTIPIVIGYSYSPSYRGRSGGGIMIKSNSGSFSIDPNFAGTPDDNFITRAFSGREQEINNIIARILNA